MKSYVLCFAHPIPHANTTDIVVIERKKIDWQTGKLNLPGGSVNEGETPVEAAVRELREETSLVASIADTKVLGTVRCNDCIVYVCFCPYRNWHDGAPQEPKAVSDEGAILSLSWRELMVDPRLIPNLKIIIPFCLARLTDWSINGTGAEPTWVVKLGE